MAGLWPRPAEKVNSHSKTAQSYISQVSWTKRTSSAPDIDQWSIQIRERRGVTSSEHDLALVSVDRFYALSFYSTSLTCSLIVFIGCAVQCCINYTAAELAGSSVPGFMPVVWITMTIYCDAVELLQCTMHGLDDFVRA